MTQNCSICDRPLGKLGENPRRKTCGSPECQRALANQNRRPKDLYTAIAPGIRRYYSKKLARERFYVQVSRNRSLLCGAFDTLEEATAARDAWRAGRKFQP